MNIYNVSVTVTYTRRYSVEADDQEGAIRELKNYGLNATLEEEEGPNFDWDNATVEVQETD